MYKVTLKSSYKDMEFVFETMQGAAAFMGMALKYNIEEKFTCGVEMYIVPPEEFEHIDK